MKTPKARHRLGGVFRVKREYEHARVESIETDDEDCLRGYYGYQMHS